MNATIKDVLIFAAGALVGSAAAYKITKDIYERRNQEDYEAIKEWYVNRENERIKRAEKLAKELGVPDHKTEIEQKAKDISNTKGYVDYSKISEPVKPEVIKPKDVKDVNEPYVISPDDFGEYMDYEQISLTHYADGILTDDDNNPIEDLEYTVGEDYADHFGEYEDDSVFIRNDDLEIDYEILADQRKYSDVVHYGARRTED